MPPGRASHTGSHGETPGSVRRKRETHGKKTLPWFLLSFPGGSDSREYAYNAGDLASIPGGGRGGDAREKGRVSRLRIS